MFSRPKWIARDAAGATLGSAIFFTGVAFAGGTGWQPVGDPGASISGTVRAIEVIDLGNGPSLYIAGTFDSIGSESFNNIARWDGQNWHPLATPEGVAGVNGTVLSIGMFDDGSGPAIYATGSFTSAGGVPVDRVARWDGSSWASVPWATSLPVTVLIEALQAFDDGNGPALYMTGLFFDVISGATNTARGPERGS